MNSKKGRQVDSSIAQAYIQIIRNAENFIFIENQYFLGSAYSWLQNDDVNCIANNEGGIQPVENNQMNLQVGSDRLSSVDMDGDSGD